MESIKGASSKFSWAVIAAAVFGMALSACGGGGSSSSGSAPPPQSNPTPTPTPIPTPDPERKLLPNAEIPPTLSAPQAGSTAQVGVLGEGIYRNGLTSATASIFVSDDYYMMQVLPSNDFLGGVVQVTGSDWVFTPPTIYLGATVAAADVTGRGSFVDKALVSGTYSSPLLKGGRSQSFTGNYSPANALAVRQDSIAGEWTNQPVNTLFGVRITVAPDGSFQGRTTGSIAGVCNLTGTLELVRPGSAKNMYRPIFQATDAAQGSEKACALVSPQGGEYAGRTAIEFVPAGNFASNGSYRYLPFVVAGVNGAFAFNLFRPEVAAGL